MGDMEGTNRSAAQSLAAAQAARNSYNQQHQGQPHAYGGANNGDTAVEIERRRGHMQGDAEEQHCTVTLFTYYFRNILGILRVVELVIGIIVIACANAEQCVYGGVGSQTAPVVCGSPTSPMWFGELGGQGFVLFVGIIFIFGNIALIIYHLMTRPSSLSSSMAENVRFGELIYNAAAVILYIIAASVEAWYASWTTLDVKFGPDYRGQSGNPNQVITHSNPYQPQWIASTVFAWINVLVYAADAVYMYFFDEGAPSVSGSSNR